MENLRGGRVFTARRRLSQGRIRESAAYRHQALTQKEQKGIENIKTLIRAIYIDWKRNSAPNENFIPEELRRKIAILVYKLHGAVFVERAVFWRKSRISKSFADFTDSECWERFRFRK
jgi:hypothetical protein